MSYILYTWKARPMPRPAKCKGAAAHPVNEMRIFLQIFFTALLLFRLIPLGSCSWIFPYWEQKSWKESRNSLTSWFYVHAWHCRFSAVHVAYFYSSARARFFAIPYSCKSRIVIKFSNVCKICKSYKILCTFVRFSIWIPTRILLSKKAHRSKIRE